MLMLGIHEGTRINKQCAGSYCNKTGYCLRNKSKNENQYNTVKIETTKAENGMQSTISYTSENHSVHSLEPHF